MTASLVLCAVGIAIVAMSLPLRLGTLDEPGTGFFPFWSGVLIVCLSFATGVMAWLGPSAAVAPWPLRAGMPAYFLVAVLLAYAMILERLGFLLSTFLLLLILFRMMGTGRLVMVVAASAGISVAAYTIFRGALGLQLPSGVLGF